jgi:hypothetical protein
LRWAWRPDQERWDKPPLQASNPHLPAKSNDPATWASYTNAVAAVAAGQADGIGYMLADDDLDAVDLDHCRDPHTGEVAEWAQAEIDAANSYAEVTVSGMGLRILGIGSGGRASPQIPDSQHDERCSGGFTPEPTDTSPSAARRSVAAIEALRHSAGYLRELRNRFLGPHSGGLQCRSRPSKRVAHKPPPPAGRDTQLRGNRHRLDHGRMGVRVAAADGGHHYSAGRTLYSARQSNLGSERGGETYRDLHTALGRLANQRRKRDVPVAVAD